MELTDDSVEYRGRSTAPVSPRQERAHEHAPRSTTAPGGSTPLPPGHYWRCGACSRSEWTKLRTVRSTMWTLGVTIVLGIGFSALATAETAAHWSTMSFGDRLELRPDADEPDRRLLRGSSPSASSACSSMSAEYGTGTIRATLSAAPQPAPGARSPRRSCSGRSPSSSSEVVAFARLLPRPGAPQRSGDRTRRSPAPGALRAVAGSGLYLCVLGLFALGLATIIRHTAGAISAFVGILLVLPARRSGASERLTLDSPALPAGQHRQGDLLGPPRLLFLFSVGRVRDPLRLRGRDARDRRDDARQQRCLRAGRTRAWPERQPGRGRQ